MSEPKLESTEILALRSRITELELALAQHPSRARLLSFLQSVTGALTEAVMIFDEKGMAVHGNQPAKNLFGMLPRTLSDLPRNLTLTPLRDDNGESLATLVVFPAASDLGNSADVEPDYRVLAQTIPQLVFLTAPSGSVEFVNERTTEYTGMSAEALYGAGWRAIIHPDDLTEFERCHIGDAQSCAVFEGEIRIRDAAGNYRWFLTRCIPVTDAAGTILKKIGSCTDIHDRRNAADLAQHQQKWLEAIFDVMPVGVVFVEIGTAKVTFANQFIHVMSGGTLAFAQNLGEYEALYACRDEDGNPLPASAYPAARVAKGERLDGLQLRWDTTEGRRNLICHSHDLPAMFGQPPTGILIVQDISPLILAESELRQKQAELLRSNEDLQEFAYAASHDLQEPLRMVSGYIQLLSRRYAGKLDPEADEYIQFAVDGANRMGQLIRDLLAFSRLGNAETRRLELVDMASAVHWALLNLQASIKECAAEITVDPLPSVTGDQSRLALVMQNLIGNSLKYRSAEPPKIHISAVRDAEYWIFCVADNGCGFEMKYADRIFGVFKRLHGKDFPGTGIGLSIAKKVVQIHKGRIWAESEPAKGSRFYFTLPVEEH